jgi:hypothetical protein
MEKLFELAVKVADPLALGGLIAMAIFFLLQKVLDRTPRVNQKIGGVLLRDVVHKLFIIAILAMVLGLTAYLVPKFIEAPKMPPTATAPPSAAASSPAPPELVSQAFNRRIGNNGSCTESNVVQRYDLCLREGATVTDWSGGYHSVRNGSAAVARKDGSPNCVVLELRYSDSGRSVLGDCRGNGWVDYNVTVNGRAAPP